MPPSTRRRRGRALAYLDLRPIGISASLSRKQLRLKLSYLRLFIFSPQGAYPPGPPSKNARPSYSIAATTVDNGCTSPRALALAKTRGPLAWPYYLVERVVACLMDRLVMSLVRPINQPTGLMLSNSLEWSRLVEGVGWPWGVLWTPVAQRPPLGLE